MDLSAIIFVVLALAWAVYLIPKALKHHDEMASDRLVEGHSDKVRILSRHGRKAAAAEAEPAPVEAPVEEPDVPVAEQVPAAAPAPVRVPTRAAARRAARNRRRVLSFLVLCLAILVGLASFAIVPWWSTAIPGGLVVAFLVVARVSVRKSQQRRRTVTSTPVEYAAAAPTVEQGRQAAPLVEQGRQAAPLVEQGRQAPVEITADEFVALLNEDATTDERQRVESVLADDGSLWDPLPMTLPTYVNKARARRTVRTIELTGINSSGHDQGDTAMAREAEADAAAAKTEDSAEQRRVAGA